MIRRRLAAFVVAASLVFSVGYVARGQAPMSDREALEAIGRILVDQGIVLPTTTAATTTTSTSSSTTSSSTTTTVPPTTTTTQPPTTTTTVAPPSACTGVQVAAGANLVTVANAHSAGTTFCLASGTYSVTAAIPFQSGDRWIGATGAASVLTGGGITQYLVTATTQNVLLKNLILERFNNPIQQGINTGAQTFWTLDNVELRFNTTGWHTHDDSRVINSYIHHNRQLGLGGQGDRVLIENNEIAFNNWEGIYDWGFEAGGSKWVNAANLIVRGNHSYSNCGPGLWTDGTGNVGIIYDDNLVENNHGPGIMHEIGGQAVISNNTATGNAFGNASGVCNSPGTQGGYGGGILIADSHDVEVLGNTLAGNDGGIVLINDNRGAGVDTYNNWVHDNDLTDLDPGGYGITGCRDNDTANDQCFTGNNRWTSNHYHAGADPTPFDWRGAERTWTQWQGYGHDLTGSID